MNIDAVTIRPAATQDLNAIAQLRADGFGGTQERSLNHIKNTPRYGIEHMVVAEFEGNVVGTGTAFPAKMWLSGVPLDVGAVAAVTVLPEHQNKGIAAKIMQYLIAHMHQENQALSLLFPFSHKYYGKFGYGTVGDLHAYRIDPNNLIVSEEGHKVRPFTLDDLPIIRVLYKGQLTWRNGWFTRSNEWWDKIISEWPNIMVYDNGEMVGGFYSYHISTNQDGTRTLQIKEFFAAEPEALQGLVSYLAAQQEAGVIEYLAPADTPFRYCLRQPIAVGAQNRGWVFNDLCHITPGPMARIISLPKALTTRFYTRGMSGVKIIKVTDPLIPDNEDLLAFRLVDGRAETHPAESHTPDIETDITTLTQILCGYMKAMDAYRLGRFKTSEDTASWIDKICVDTPLYIQAGDWF